MQKQIEGLGTNLLTVQAGGRGFGRAAAGSSQFTFLTMKDVKALSDKAVAPDIASVSPVVNASSVTATRGVATETPGQVIGTTASYAEARKETVTEGTFITPQDEADHARGGVLLAGRVEEQDARRAEQAESLEQRLVLGRVRGDVDLQQQRVGHAAAYRGVAEGQMLHLLA